MCPIYMQRELGVAIGIGYVHLIDWSSVIWTYSIYVFIFNYKMYSHSMYDKWQFWNTMSQSTTGIVLVLYTENMSLIFETLVSNLHVSILRALPPICPIWIRKLFRNATSHDHIQNFKFFKKVYKFWKMLKNKLIFQNL